MSTDDELAAAVLLNAITTALLPRRRRWTGRVWLGRRWPRLNLTNADEGRRWAWRRLVRRYVQVGRR